MATDIYSYDSAVARDAEGGLGSTISALEASLADLGGFVNQVTQNWEGDEQVLYKGIQTKWDGASDQIKQILAQIKTSLGQTTESVDTMRGKVSSALQAG